MDLATSNCEFCTSNQKYVSLEGMFLCNFCFRSTEFKHVSSRNAPERIHTVNILLYGNQYFFSRSIAINIVHFRHILLNMVSLMICLMTLFILYFSFFFPRLKNVVTDKGLQIKGFAMKIEFS